MSKITQFALAGWFRLRISPAIAQREPTVSVGSVLQLKSRTLAQVITLAFQPNRMN